MEETWKDIKGFEGLYQISNLGRVKSLERTYTNFGGTISRIKEGIKTQYIKGDKTKRKVVVLSVRGVRKDFDVARLVAEAFLPKPTRNQTRLLHIDGDYSNNNVFNLKWCTIRQQNRALGIDKRIKRKTVVVNVKLTKEVKVAANSYIEAEAKVRRLFTTGNIKFDLVEDYNAVTFTRKTKDEKE